MNENSLTFKVSTGLKNIIGKDLISDKYIAVFELVKNSYDAGATKVIISFIRSKTGSLQLKIADDGCGMNYDDIVNKWLFVAYSAKKKENRAGASYRAHIKREMAGAKGVGRFSCDRLGENLILITRIKKESIAHEVRIPWNQFEEDDTQEFITIPVEYKVCSEIPFSYESGTVLIIDGLREEWDRESLLKLKRSLMKLISPDTDNGDLPFEIEMIVPDEMERDNPNNLFGKTKTDRDTVNGVIHNDIIEKINIKTTRIVVTISEDGTTISSALDDRGERIFFLSERNVDFRSLHGITCSLFYLNRRAKMGFTKQMGVEAVNYGSIFMYKNGFRINPYGEPGQDFFEIDKRKAQGYNRFLGTRELMGRITIQGNNPDFIETSSRAHGFIETPSVNMLSEFFLEKALKVLEKYVVNVISWGEPLKDQSKNIISPAIQPSDIGEEVIAQFFKRVSKDNIIEYVYNQELLQKNQAQPNSMTSSLKNLERVATDSGDSNIAGLAKDIRKKTDAILSQNVELERENEEKDREIQKSRQESTIREQQVHFLKGVTNQNVENLLNGMHSIFTLTEASKSFLKQLRGKIDSYNINQNAELINILSEVYQANQKVNKLAELAIKGNQHLKQEGKNDVFAFITQYIDSGLSLNSIIYDIVPPKFSTVCEFDSSSLGIVIDNIASNSLKAAANRLTISFIDLKTTISIAFTDNGVGLSKNLDPEMLFEWGASTTRSNKGFGIGLYHIKLLAEEMHGTVSIDKDYKKGFRMVVNLKK